jgi:hypothetical protein
MSLFQTSLAKATLGHLFGSGGASERIVRIDNKRLESLVPSVQAV